jgi:hypothetical protein
MGFASTGEPWSEGAQPASHMHGKIAVSMNCRKQQTLLDFLSIGLVSKSKMKIQHNRM